MSIRSNVRILRLDRKSINKLCVSTELSLGRFWPRIPPGSTLLHLLDLWNNFVCKKICVLIVRPSVISHKRFRAPLRLRGSYETFWVLSLVGGVLLNVNSSQFKYLTGYKCLCSRDQPAHGRQLCTDRFRLLFVERG